MKKVIAFTVLSLSLSTSFAQQAKQQKLKNDSTQSYKTIIVLDSIEYKNLITFLGSIPVSNPSAGYIFNLVNGKDKNVGQVAMPANKPKTTN